MYVCIFVYLVNLTSGGGVSLCGPRSPRCRRTRSCPSPPRGADVRWRTRFAALRTQHLFLTVVMVKWETVVHSQQNFELSHLKSMRVRAGNGTLRLIARGTAGRCGHYIVVIVLMLCSVVYGAV